MNFVDRHMTIRSTVRSPNYQKKIKNSKWKTFFTLTYLYCGHVSHLPYLLERVRMRLLPAIIEITKFTLMQQNCKIAHRSLTSCDRNLESSNFLIAYFISSCLKNSTTPVPSLYVSAKQTSPASRIWSFKSCHEPLAGNPDTSTRNCERFVTGPRLLLPSPRLRSLPRLPR